MTPLSSFNILFQLPRTVSEIFSVKNGVTLKSWLGGRRSKSLKMVITESLGTVSYSHSIATMAVSLPFRHNTRTWWTPDTARWQRPRYAQNRAANLFGQCTYTIAVWFSSNASVLVNEVALRRLRLVSGWVTVRSGKPCRCRTSHPGLLSLAIPPSLCRRNEYQRKLRSKQAHHVMQQPMSVVSQCWLVSGWGLVKRRSVQMYGKRYRIRSVFARWCAIQIHGFGLLHNMM